MPSLRERRRCTHRSERNREGRAHERRWRTHRARPAGRWRATRAPSGACSTPRWMIQLDGAGRRDHRPAGRGGAGDSMSATVSPSTPAAPPLRRTACQGSATSPTGSASSRTTAASRFSGAPGTRAGRSSSSPGPLKGLFRSRALGSALRQSETPVVRSTCVSSGLRRRTRRRARVPPDAGQR